MKLNLTTSQSKMLNEVLYAATNNAVKGQDMEVAVVLNELNKRVGENRLFIKVKKYEAEYLGDFIDGIRESLEEAETFLLNEEEPRENREELLSVAREKREEATQMVEMIRNKINGI